MGRDRGTPARVRAITRRRVLLAIVATGAVAAACQPVKPPAPPPPTEPEAALCVAQPPATAEEYQDTFDGLFADGIGRWRAADGGQPVPLPGGRVLWLFGDTILGRSAPGGTIAYEGVANNGFVVQDGACFEPISEPLPDPAREEWIWPTGAVVDEGGGEPVLRVVGLHMRRTGADEFDFAIVGMVVASFSLPDLTLEGDPVPLPVPQMPTDNPTYGESLTVVEDTAGRWVYAYGETRRIGLLGLPIANHYLARVPVDQILSEAAWQFWHDDPATTGDEAWVPAAVDATPLVFDDGTDLTPSVDEGPVAALPVTPRPDGTFVASAFRLDVIGGPIETWHAPTPSGPFTLVTTPAVDAGTVAAALVEDQFAYGGRVLFDIQGAPIAVWSVNHLSFDAILEDPTLYKVWFVPLQEGWVP